MALPVSVLLALVMLCSSPACPLGCDLPLSHGHQEAFTLLSQMERISIRSCLKDRVDFRFPQMLVDGHQLEKTQAAAVVHETLQQIFHLFSTSGSPAAWDETLLDQFLVGLYQQLDDLETCLGKETKVQQSPLGSENSRLAVKRYFHRISLYLKEKEHSACAWEVVRVEIRRCFLFMNKLTGKLGK
ncbi:interferon alpha-2-like [Diceros bicornis minor]|uniref:interferon alpha-2-like n=1 Tax=Diceros bicornis minor TaxID=77932 RepID=UPI0026EF9A1D|nr:interferon alpha-2-like [Diceros bicornis minor]